MIAGSSYLFVKLPRTVLLCLLCLAFCVTGKAQHNDTSRYDLQQVVIVAMQETSLQPSKQVEAIDSTVMARSSSRSLSELLAEQSTIYIKSYGAGNIATTSFRGGNANHTALLWNGLNIQNAMLGQTDLSIIPSLFFDKLSLEYGGGSALWGSGAIGGTIRLDNELPFERGLVAKVQSSLGSFDTRKLASSLMLSSQRVASSTRFYRSSSLNNYPYRDSSDREQPLKHIRHADYVMQGLMQELSFRTGKSQRINLRAWYNKANRNLPSYTSALSQQNQLDETLKLNADWNFRYRRLSSTVRLAGFQDRLNYNDSLSNIYSKSRIRTLIAETDHVYKLRRHVWSIGANYTAYGSEMPVATVRSGVAQDSLIRHEQRKFALYGLYRLSFFGNRLSYDLAARKEFSPQTQIPLTGNSGVYFQALRWLALKLSVAKAYRQPTLNDLYWPQGGNRDLKPEESKELNAGLVLKKTIKRISLLFEGTYFNRHTRNWIIWLPTASAYFSPRNVAEVYSRGAETRTELTYQHGELFLKLGVATGYVLSTNEAPTNENDRAVGRQLIYTPRYTGQSTFTCAYKGLTLLLTQSYTGYRFTSTDNSTWLDPYYLANAKLAYRRSFGTVLIELFGAVYNLFDRPYMAVANRPMPLRNYEAGISLYYHQNFKNPKHL